MTSRHDQLRAECQAFHDEHPEVWTLFERFTRERIRAGYVNYSVNAIFEQIRWHTDKPDVDGKSTFKINNNFRSFYARRFHRVHPEHDGFFRLREQISREVPASNLPPLGPNDYPQENPRL